MNSLRTYIYAGIQGDNPLDGALKGKTDMWVKLFSLGSLGNERTILCHGNRDALNDDDLSIFSYSHSGHGRLTAALRDIGGGGTSHEPASTNQWYHLALEWDGSQFC